jgi:hypothetical protein
VRSEGREVTLNRYHKHPKESKSMETSEDEKRRDDRRVLNIALENLK